MEQPNIKMIRKQANTKSALSDTFKCFEELEDGECKNASQESPSSLANESSLNLQAGTQEEKNELFCDVNSENEEPEEHIAKRQKTSSVFDDINPEEFSKRIKIYSSETSEGCLHEVAVPPDMDYIMPDQSGMHAYEPAKEYPFSLDPFQKEAILCIENKQSVLVSAHTSAGKTVVAEYAIAKSLQEKQHVIYTTPIKALSNQKYQEFCREFKDVGLMTGDVTINPSAPCLIMTTEILRSMLYRGSELLGEGLAWVIFDEIHYMRDKERGFVWEEAIILLPDDVHYVFLSATIPNATQFAEWICSLHKQPCHVVYTDYRPVPLQQFIFPAGADGIHLVVDEKGNFLEKNFSAAMDALQVMSSSKSGSRVMGCHSKKVSGNIYKVVKLIIERNYTPAIVFSFSRKDCETYAVNMAKLNLTTKKEAVLIETVFQSATAVLSPVDKKLPQVKNVLPLLMKGIAIHHSGLLPILKETIEILFSEGLIKVLFATETFAMGLNMPARTVLFTSVQKFDGKNFRWITSGEYIQMSGRAGRRGLDSSGIVIVMLNEKISPTIAKDIVKGLPDPINSAFQLTYSMVLNLMRVDDVNPEFMLERSFLQFQNYSVIPKLYNELIAFKEEYDCMVIPKEQDVMSFHTIKKNLSSAREEIHSYVIQPRYCLPFIRAGRLVKIQSNSNDFGWGIVVNIRSKPPSATSRQATETKEFVVDCLISIARDSVSTIRPPEDGMEGEMKVVPVALNTLKEISSILTYYPHDLRPIENRMKVQNVIKQIMAKFPDGLPVLHPVKDMHIKDERLLDALKRKELFECRLRCHPLKSDPHTEELLQRLGKKMELEVKIEELKTKLKEARSLVKMEELKHRKRVLRRLGFVSATDVVEAKGRVACEISSADGLLLTEMMFAGVFNDLDIHQINALLSCFVLQEKSNQTPKLVEELSGPLRLMQNIASKIARVSKECRLDIETASYIKSFKPNLMDVVYAWSKGKSFQDVCKMTDIFEGSIIRCLRRLEELLRQLCQASRATGNAELEAKFVNAIKSIKRDIAFAASLYL